MAEIGVPIDFSKKYKTERGKKVIAFNKTLDKNYPLKVSFYNDVDRFYTSDGFFWINKESSTKNLILDEEENMQKHKINIDRPQDYMFSNFPEKLIQGFVLKPNGSWHTLIVNYLDIGGIYDHVAVGDFGNNHIDESESNYDVILRPELAEKPAEIKAESKKRIVKNILKIGDNLIALSDDGNLYSSFRLSRWTNIPSLPQD